MKITNPSNGETLKIVTEDNVNSVHEKYLACKAAQKKWQDKSIEERKKIIEEASKKSAGKMGNSVSPNVKSISPSGGPPLENSVIIFVLPEKLMSGR